MVLDVGGGVQVLGQVRRILHEMKPFGGHKDGSRA